MNKKCQIWNTFEIPILYYPTDTLVVFWAILKCNESEMHAKRFNKLFN